MPATRNAAVIFVSVPEGLVVPGEHLVYREDEVIDLENAPLNGGVLTKTLCLGIDPYLRNLMVYVYTPGKPMLGFGVGVVLRSEDPKYKPGDHLYTESYPFQEYTIFNPPPADTKVLKDEGLPWHTYLGVLGLPGYTGWTGYKALAHAKPGETIYVSTAAGTVGSVVCQIAKAEGLRIIASTGSDEKVKYLKEELGVDVAFNYKKENIGDVLQKHGPIDIYWDAVGGQALETTIDHMNKYGRIVICGFIAGYNSKEAYGVKNTGQILIKSLTVSGFVVNDLIARYGNFNFYTEAVDLVKQGKLKIRDQISHNLADAPHLLLDMFKGTNYGKPTIVLADN